MSYHSTQPQLNPSYPLSSLFTDFNPANDTAAVSLYKNHPPETPQGLYQLAQESLQRNQYTQALAQFNRLLQLVPKNLAATAGMALCLLKTDRLELALKTYRLAQYLAPQNTEILKGIANCYERQGHFHKAISVYEAVLKKQPYNIDCLYNLVLIGNVTPDSPTAQRLKTLHQLPDVPISGRILVCFALAKIYESHADAQQAFSYYEEGNRLKFSTLSYNETGLFDYFDMLEKTCDERLFAKLGHLGNSDATPIFVLGMARSGTSLVEQILATHSQVHGAGEVSFMVDIVAKLIPQLTGKSTPDAVCDLNQAAFTSLSTYYLKGLRSYSPQQKHIVDKMPSNFFNIGLIQLLLPNAKIIHCVRDPMDTCWSLYRQYFTGAHPYSYDQGALGRAHRRYEQLMNHWHRVLPGKIHVVSYEQLVDQPYTMIAGLLDHCGLSWEEQCLQFYQTKRTVSTASMRQVRRPLYKSSLQSWKPVAEELASLRRALNY